MAPNPWLAANGQKCIKHDTKETLEGHLCGFWDSANLDGAEEDEYDELWEVSQCDFEPQISHMSHAHLILLLLCAGGAVVPLGGGRHVAAHVRVDGRPHCQKRGVRAAGVDAARPSVL